MKIQAVKGNLFHASFEQLAAFDQAATQKQKRVSMINVVAPFGYPLNGNVILFVHWRTTRQNLHPVPPFGHTGALFMENAFGTADDFTDGYISDESDIQGTVHEINKGGFPDVKGWTKIY